MRYHFPGAVSARGMRIAIRLFGEALGAFEVVASFSQTLAGVLVARRFYDSIVLRLRLETICKTTLTYEERTNT